MGRDGDLPVTWHLTLAHCRHSSESKTSTLYPSAGACEVQNFSFVSFHLFLQQKRLRDGGLARSLKLPL